MAYIRDSRNGWTITKHDTYTILLLLLWTVVKSADLKY